MGKRDLQLSGITPVSKAGACQLRALHLPPGSASGWGMGGAQLGSLQSFFPAGSSKAGVVSHSSLTPWLTVQKYCWIDGWVGSGVGEGMGGGLEGGWMGWREDGLIVLSRWMERWVAG